MAIGQQVLSQRDSELLISYLTVPYLRVPLVLTFFASGYPQLAYIPLPLYAGLWFAFYISNTCCYTCAYVRQGRHIFRLRMSLHMFVIYMSSYMSLCMTLCPRSSQARIGCTSCSQTSSAASWTLFFLSQVHNAAITYHPSPAACGL